MDSLSINTLIIAMLGWLTLYVRYCCSEEYRVLQGFKFNPHTLTRTYDEVESLTQCLILCKQTTDCYALSRNENHTSCFNYHWLLDSSKPIIMKYGTGNDIVILVRPIPVLYMANGYGFTYNAGKTFCQSLGSRMTNYTELQAVWNTGYERCGCGWLDDGRAYAPMNSVATNCFSGVGIHVCDWQGTWDVYCTID